MSAVTKHEPVSIYPTLWPRSLKSIWSHNSAVFCVITTKFGKQMQRGMPMTTHRSKTKPEIKFQYGGRPFYRAACLSVKRVICDKTEERSVEIFIPYERSFSLVFWDEGWLVGDDPFLCEIFGQLAPVGEKSPIFNIIRSWYLRRNT